MIKQKYILLFFGYIFILGCNDNSNTIKETETVFYTQDSLYKVSFIKPEELDTIYSWFSSNCTSSISEHRYRYSKKKFPITKESGWFQSPIADSTYRLTLSHIEGYISKTEIDFVGVNKPEWFLVNQMARSKEAGWNIDTFFSKRTMINNRDFMVFAYKINKDYPNKYWTHCLTAMTVVDSNILKFECECRAKDCEKFIGRMEKAINTIKVEKYK